MKSIRSLPGVGEKTEQTLNAQGIYTINDLVFNFPKRYESFKEDSLLLAVDKTNVTVTGIVATVPIVINHRGTLKSLQFKILVENQLFQVIAYRREYLQASLKEGMTIQVKGRFEKKRQRITASQIMLKPIKSEHKAVYGIEGIYDSIISKIIRAAFNTYQIEIAEVLPRNLLTKYKFTSRFKMVYDLHFPYDTNTLDKAQERLKYEEAFNFQLKIMKEKLLSERTVKTPKSYNLAKVKQFITTIPYELTSDQKAAVNDIFTDFKQTFAVKRLVQGDVGSGKTVVVAIAIYGAKTAGFQSAIMAPTEVLAQQHFELFQTNYPLIKSVLLTSSTKNKEAVKQQIVNNEYDLIIGTHALITDDTVFHNLGFVVIDEQHRFGVIAREKLETKGNPDICYLTATPIPRTLAIVIFGDMEISNIYQMPEGRLPVITKYFTKSQEQSVFEHVKKELKENRQVYFVAPAIESEHRGESVINLYNRAQEIFEEPIFMLHGKMSGAEKQQTMEEFNNTKGSILVSTTVVEVGLDIKDATMMVIFDGKYFGLSQLHQLRGRVGRSDIQSYCYVISDDIDIERLQIFEKTLDGFLLSEYDLANRGPGEFLGVKQSGMIDFKYANIETDFKIFMNAKDDALKLLKSQSHYSFKQLGT
ncbi:MAG: ATP-dependent DNA helicase RecG [Acholeplasmataceae bacterium]|jgi:ATP-dependent DNA helicase RecG|nr:ATP-dependent DNA helicase RecG [Acholeplasmataceae bacterium]